MLAGGEEALVQYKQRIETELESITDFTSNEYLKAKALQNVAYQFENVQLYNELVQLTSYNFDFIVNGKRDVMVLFCSSYSEECKTFLPVYVTNRFLQ